MEVVLRSSVADYEVVEALPRALGGGARYSCRPPDRLRRPDPVVAVCELAIEAAQWQDLVGLLSRFCVVESDHLLELIEVGPDLDPEGAGVYLATEAAPGGSLSETSGGEIGAKDRIRAIAQAARAVHALHEAGIAHGGLCGRTIMLTDRGAALAPPPLDVPEGVLTKVTDWRDLVTLDPDVLSGEEASRSSDIWALGATLHVVLSDRPMYPGIDEDAPVTAVQRILFTRPEIDPGLPQAISEVIAACIELDPGARFETADQMAEHLLGSEVVL